MNTDRQQAHRPLVSRLPHRMGAGLVVFALACSSALADPPSTSAADTATERVSLAGLDLATPEGAHEAYQRIKLAAQQVCWKLGDDRKISNLATYDRCVTDTVAQTVRSINAAALLALVK